MKEIQLGKLEITRIYGFIQMHPNEELFTIKEENGSGIGYSVEVSITDKPEIKENVTDYNLW